MKQNVGSELSQTSFGQDMASARNRIDTVGTESKSQEHTSRNGN